MGNSSPQKYMSIVFGGYSASFKDVLEEARIWLLKHPEIETPTGYIATDEGYYMTLFWEVKEDNSYGYNTDKS